LGNTAEVGHIFILPFRQPPDFWGRVDGPSSQGDTSAMPVGDLSVMTAIEVLMVIALVYLHFRY
jgi:hypothetical protein